MKARTQREDIATGQRRFRLAVFRALLALAYLAMELFGSAPRPRLASGAVIISLFVAYSIVLLVFHSHRQLQSGGLYVLFLDLVFLLLLVFGGSGGEAALAATFYVFVVLESRALHGAREVLLIATAVTLIYYASRIRGVESEPLVIGTHWVLYLLVVVGVLAFWSYDRRHVVENRILRMAQRTTGASESATAAAIQEALKELAIWLGCSHALLAFWDERGEHYCLCRFPPAERRAKEPAGPQLEDSREWAVCRGERLDFATNNPEAGTTSGDFDLHPLLIQKFQISNAVGCGLYHNERAVGRLVLINRVSPVRNSVLRKLESIAPAFTDFARHVLALKAAEITAFEQERSRLAQDFHDGPLQSIISFQMRVHLIRKLLDKDPAAAARELDQLQDLSRRQVTEMRTFVHSMRPVEVGTSSLTAAARRLVDDFQKESGVAVTFLGPEEPVPAPTKIGVDILQLIREALTNIHKHAQATHVLFSLEQNDTHLTISVNDNGKGFRFGGKYTLPELDMLRLGPKSIKQRMRALGGDVQLESRPGQGASLRLTIPLG